MKVWFYCYFKNIISFTLWNLLCFIIVLIGTYLISLLISVFIGFSFMESYYISLISGILTFILVGIFGYVLQYSSLDKYWKKRIEKREFIKSRTVIVINITYLLFSLLILSVFYLIFYNYFNSDIVLKLVFNTLIPCVGIFQIIGFIQVLKGIKHDTCKKCKHFLSLQIIDRSDYYSNARSEVGVVIDKKYYVNEFGSLSSRNERKVGKIRTRDELHTFYYGCVCCGNNQREEFKLKNQKY